MTIRSWPARVLLTAAVFLGVRGADAQERESRSDAEVTRRLAFIESRLTRATPTANLWWSLWYYGYITVTVGQAGVALGTTNKSTRTSSAVGAAFSGLGVVGLGAFDFPARHAAADLARLQASSPASRRKKLAMAERLLAASARSEVLGRGWIGQVAGVAITATSALVLAVAYKQVVSSIVTLVSGVAITEAQIFTRPTAAITDWRDYQRGAFGPVAPISPRSDRVQFGIAPHPGGAAISLTF